MHSLVKASPDGIIKQLLPSSASANSSCLCQPVQMHSLAGQSFPWRYHQTTFAFVDISKQLLSTLACANALSGWSKLPLTVSSNNFCLRRHQQTALVYASLCKCNLRSKLPLTVSAKSSCLRQPVQMYSPIKPSPYVISKQLLYMSACANVIIGQSFPLRHQHTVLVYASLCKCNLRSKVLHFLWIADSEVQALYMWIAKGLTKHFECKCRSGPLETRKG